jgi:hypothetical protein
VSKKPSILAITRVQSIQQQNLLKKLVTDNIVQGFALPLHLDKIASILGVLLTPSTSKCRTLSKNVARSSQKTTNTHPMLEVAAGDIGKQQS